MVKEESLFDYSFFIKNIGANIRRYRLKAGLLQRDLAQQIDASVSIVTNIERGFSSTTLCKIYKIAQILKINPVLLFEDDTYFCVSKQDVWKQWLKDGGDNA